MFSYSPRRGFPAFLPAPFDLREQTLVPVRTDHPKDPDKIAELTRQQDSLRRATRRVSSVLKKGTFEAPLESMNALGELAVEIGYWGPLEAYQAWWASDGHRIGMFQEGPDALGIAREGRHWSMALGAGRTAESKN